MNVAFFHGLESSHPSSKSIFLENKMDFAYCPPMNYNNPDLFKTTLKNIQSMDLDLLIGSSMGGWFAYCISTITGIPTLLFNPALQGRSIEPPVKLGNKKTYHTIILGKNDIVINPILTLEWLNKNSKSSYDYNIENIGHRTPIDVFKKWVLYLK